MKNTYQIAWLFIVVLFLLCSKASADDGDKLIWTVQLGSYESVDEARGSFEKYLSTYPHDPANLRIEEHSPYFALRSGSFADKLSAQEFLDRVKSGFPDALLVHAYFRLDRIVEQASPVKSAVSNQPHYFPKPIVSSESKSQKSIVPAQDRISDIESRIMLTELLMSMGRQEDLARIRAVLESLRKSLPDDNRVLILLIRLELTSDNREKALSFMDELYLQENDPDTLLELADMYASLGHYEKCRDIFITVLQRLSGKRKQEAVSIFADRTMLWGDFYRGEDILRREIQNNPHDPETYLRLARNLMAQQRYEQAGKNIDKALSIEGATFSRMHEEIWSDKLNLALLERDFAKAAKMSSQFIDVFGLSEDMLLTLARSYYLNGQTQKFRELSRLCIEHESLEYDGLINLGRLAEKDDETDLALEYYSEAARKDPARPDAVLRAMMLREESVDTYVNELISQEINPADLEQLAWFLTDNKEYDLAVNCLETAVDIDNDFFPARMSLSEIYGIMGEYEKSLDILAELEDKFPQTFKVSLTKARVLAWSRQYDLALDAYEDLFEANDKNHVVMIEAGRTAYWGKMADRGDEFYSKLFDPAVDEMLWGQLSEKFDNVSVLPPSLLDDLQLNIDSGSIYSGYEEFFGQIQRHPELLSAEVLEIINMILKDLEPCYLIQKRAFLEQQSKNMAWNRRFAPARRHLKELVELQPGNQEAWFDLAQASCVLGLCDQEAKTYEQLLIVDPNNTLAVKALERQKDRSRPLISAGYDFWKEKGRGDLARMSRHRFDLGVEVPVFCRHNLSLTWHKYIESPDKYGSSVQADGISIDGKVVASAYLTLRGGLTHKTYSQRLKVKDFQSLAPSSTGPDQFKAGLDDQTLGYLDMLINFDSYAHLTLGFTRQEELANVMALAQGIYSDRFKARLDVFPARKWDWSFGGEYIDYRDGNSGQMYETSLGYAFTDHPRMFKATLAGQVRDTSKEYQACSEMQCSIKDDFHHPYWTPRNYWSAALILEFRHDLAEDFFCGARDHYYELRLSLGTEKDNNHSIEAMVRWVREFTPGLGIDARAMWHNSREWDAISLGLGAFYRF